MPIASDLGHITRRQYSGSNAIRVILYCFVVTLVVVEPRVIRSERSTSHRPYGLNSPCGPRNSDASPFMSIGPLQRNDVLPKVEEVQGITNQLREQYEGMMPLPEIYSEEVIGLPGPEDISAHRNVTVDYTVVSHLLVFVDIICTDHGTPHEVVQPYRRDRWQQLRLRILSLLCSMYRRMINAAYISKDITLPCVIEASCSGQRTIFTRERRNFVIASAIRDVFSRLHQTYSLLPVQ